MVKFGSTLLTDYFTFTAPDSLQKDEDKVIADSNNFALNCQAALQFYQADPTVRSTYKRFYHIGWPFHRSTWAIRARPLREEEHKRTHVM